MREKISIVAVVAIAMGIMMIPGRYSVGYSDVQAIVSGGGQTNSVNNTLNNPPFNSNATTKDYKLEFEIGPPANMLKMGQVTNSTTPGEVMVAGQMSPMIMTGHTYHLELHVFNIKTGATEVVPTSSVHITVTSPSGTKITVPIAEMFDIGQGPIDFHYGNNVVLAPGKSTVYTSVGSENKSFNVTIGSKSPSMSSGMSMK
jgi:hypothetical protein